MKNRFTNPATGAFYDWDINHDPEGEELAGKTRQITRTPNTSGGGVVLQQGEDGSYVIKLSAMWAWYRLCRTQTIYFRDFDGQDFEVVISSFQSKRKGKLGPSGRDPSVPYHFWEYTIEMTVVKFRSGDLATVGVLP
jgi:hypothetical protein